MKQVAFIGLGLMGKPMARNILKAGYPLTVQNRTRDKTRELEKAGAQVASTPGEAARSADVVITMVSDPPAVREVVLGPQGVVHGARRGAVLIDMSTISPADSRSLADEMGKFGISLLDAPVSGSVSTLEEGKLSIMAAGDRDAFERVRQILEAIGPKVTYVGPNGQAVLMKIATNLSLAVQMLAFSEGVLLAEKGGIPRPIAVDVLLNSVIASPMIRYRGPFVLGRPEEAWFDVGMMQKDMTLALDLGRELSVPLPTTSVTDQLLTAARAMGFGSEDFAVLFEVLRTVAGMREAV